MALGGWVLLLHEYEASWSITSQPAGCSIHSLSPFHRQKGGECFFLSFFHVVMLTDFVLCKREESFMDYYYYRHSRRRRFKSELIFSQRCMFRVTWVVAFFRLLSRGVRRKTETMNSKREWGAKDTNGELQKCYQAIHMRS